MWGGPVKGVSSSSMPMECRKLVLVSHITSSQTRHFLSPHGSPRQPQSLVFPKGSGTDFSLFFHPHDPSFFGLQPHPSVASSIFTWPPAFFLQGHLSLGS